MPDRVLVDIDDRALDIAFEQLPVYLQRRANDAASVTAQRIVVEAQGRLARQLSGASSGRTVAGIHAQPAYDGNGWVVLADNEAQPNLPLWLEKGTRAGKRANFARTKARPFFYASIAVEASSHERRIREAMEEAGSDAGLG